MWFLYTIIHVSVLHYYSERSEGIIGFKYHWFTHVAYDCWITHSNLLALQVRPPDDTIYVRFATKNPKRTRWVFHGKYFWMLFTEFIPPLQMIKSKLIVRVVLCHSHEHLIIMSSNVFIEHIYTVINYWAMTVQTHTIIIQQTDACYELGHKTYCNLHLKYVKTFYDHLDTRHSSY